MELANCIGCTCCASILLTSAPWQAEMKDLPGYSDQTHFFFGGGSTGGAVFFFKPRTPGD